jgi:hypothetical protein
MIHSAPPVMIHSAPPVMIHSAPPVMIHPRRPCHAFDKQFALLGITGWQRGPFDYAGTDVYV